MNIAKNKIKILLSVPFVTLLIWGYFYYYNNRYISTENSYIKMDVISIRPQVSGVIDKIFVSNNQFVKKGDLICNLDLREFLFAVNKQEALLKASIIQVQNLKDTYKSLESDLHASQTDLDYYTKEYNRIKELNSNNNASRASLDQALHQMNHAIQTVKSSQAKLSAALDLLNGNPDISVEDHPKYLEAKASLDIAKLNLEHASLKAPFDGVVSNFYLKEGATVSAYNPIYGFIDTKNFWVEANYKESQLKDVKIGQKAKVKTDIFPDLDIEAEVYSITPATGSSFSILPAQNSSGNWVKVSQRIMVSFKVNKDKLAQNMPTLVSGMSTEVTIDTKSK